MYTKKRIAAVAILAAVLWVTVVLAKNIDKPDIGRQYSERAIPGMPYQESNLFAQSDSTDPGASIDKEKAEDSSENGDAVPESVPATDDKKQSVTTKPKPLKPFVPSEKIRAEQAVDFPVDI